MKTYKHTKTNGSIWRFFYDSSIKLWTVHEVDSEGNQLSEEGHYYHNKSQMLAEHNFKFNTPYDL